MKLVDWAWLAAEEPTPASGGGAGGNSGTLMFVVLMVGVVLLFWLMSRRNKKQQGKVEDFRNTLTVGTRVMTVGGMIGVISAIHGDVITLKSPKGDETVYTKRAIREAVTDDMWQAMIVPVSVDEEAPSGNEPDEDDQTETGQPEAGESEDPKK